MRILSVFLLFALLLTSPAAFAFQKVSDDQIHDNVMRRLANDADVKGGGFQIEVKDGVVTITGTVTKEKQKTKAESLTRKVKGVKSVDNQLVVKPVGA